MGPRVCLVLRDPRDRLDLPTVITGDSARSRARGYIVAIDQDCGAGLIALAGSCGYAPLDSGAFNMRMIYSGPEPSNQQLWRCEIANTDSVAHDMYYGAFCVTPGNGGTLSSNQGGSALPTGALGDLVSALSTLWSGVLRPGVFCCRGSKPELLAGSRGWSAAFLFIRSRPSDDHRTRIGKTFPNIVRESGNFRRICK